MVVTDLREWKNSGGKEDSAFKDMMDNNRNAGGER